MAKKTLFLPLLVISLLFISFEAHSNVLVEDSQGNSNIVNNSRNVTSGTIETGNGEAGNYVVIACANDFFNGLVFDPPTPLNWTQLDQGECSGPLCSHGIWGGFVDDPNSETITCSWSPETVLFVAGSMRYTGVDPINPIIDVACDTGTGETATAPSVVTGPGSQVLRVFTSGIPLGTSTGQTPNDIAARAELNGSFLRTAGSSEFSRLLAIQGISEFNAAGGPTGVFNSQQAPGTNWRACTIALRMNPTAVPTMSEWGLIGFAAFAGIAGFWFLRRRQATA